jgi:iron(III) transport system permease protein
MEAAGQVKFQLAQKPSLWQRIDLKWVIIGLCVIVVAYLALMPLGFLVWQSFLTPETASSPSQFTLQNYVATYTDMGTVRLLGTSVQFAIGTSVFAFVVGTALAWMNERTNTPFKSLFYALSIIPLIIPSILFTIAWILLASPKIGMLNTLLQQWLGTDFVFFNVYSVWGMIWVEGLHYSPMAFLIMTAAFRSMDPSLEESAMMSGASIGQVTWRITLKLVWPAIFATILMLFVRAIESFEVPTLLGLPANIQVFTSAIYQAINEYPSKVGLASSYSVALLLITAVGLYFQSRLSNNDGKYSTVTGKGFRPRAMDLGKWRFMTAAIFVLYFAMIVVLPFAVLVWSSLQKYYAAPSAAAFKALTFDAYRQMFADPTFLTSVWNSVALAIGTATVIMLLTSVICWIVVKTKLPGRRLLDNLASLPLVFPGLVLGLAMMVFYLNFDIGIYGTLWILLLAYITRFMPYGLRYNTTSMLQIHTQLEESAAMSGASWATTFRRIVLPLLKPGLLAGWIYIVIVSIRELSASVLLYSPRTEVISVQIWEHWANGEYVELSALGVLFILALFILVMIAQMLGKKFGVKE